VAGQKCRAQTAAHCLKHGFKKELYEMSTKNPRCKKLFKCKNSAGESYCDKKDVLDIRKARKVCEKKKEGWPNCKFVKDKWMEQSSYRCVPKVSSMSKGGTSYGEPRYLKDFQTFLMQWEHPLRPYMGGTNGPVLETMAGAPESELAMNYARAGDMCLRYNPRKSRPRTKNGCLGPMWYQQMQDNYLVCMGWGNISAKIVAFLLNVMKPALKLLPGGIGTTISKAILNQAAGTLAIAIDEMLTNLPFRLGKVYKIVTWAVKRWFDFDIRNLITLTHQRSLMPSKAGFVDFAIDSQQARMQRVYAATEEDGKRCKNMNGKPKEMPDDEWCPDAIPIRNGITSVARAGDHSTTVMNSMWPLREAVKSGRQNMNIAYMKLSVCILMPKCNKDLPSIYNGPHYADCSGSGQCVWNKRKGNHCKCDAGCSGILCEQGTNKLTKKPCSSSNRNSPQESRHFRAPSKKRAETPINKVKKNANRRTNKGVNLGGVQAEKTVWSKRAAAFLCNSIVDQASRDHGCFREFSAAGGGSSVQAISEMLGDIGRISDLESKPDPTKCLKPLEGFPTSIKQMLLPREVINGRDVKSGKNDETEWHCSTSKKILDCKQVRQFAPWDMDWVLDQLCGKIMFKQKIKKVRQCSGKTRKEYKRHWCSKNSDCPGGYCGTYRKVDGCQHASAKPCSLTGFDKMAAMGL